METNGSHQSSAKEQLTISEHTSMNSPLPEPTMSLPENILENSQNSTTSPELPTTVVKLFEIRELRGALEAEVKALKEQEKELEPDALAELDELPVMPIIEGWSISIRKAKTKPPEDFKGSEDTQMKAYVHTAFEAQHRDILAQETFLRKDWERSREADYWRLEGQPETLVFSRKSKAQNVE